MKAIVLLSGGLDSSLALKLIHDQGIDCLALHFSSPFCRCDGSRGCGSSAHKMSEFVGVRLRSIFLGDEYLEIVKKPRHGRGKNLNPCIDCRILKFVHAKKVMEEEGASFVVTGEVLGQRPMSQHKVALDLIEKRSELKGLVVRPLSAKVLQPTIPEEKGWVDRDAFLDIQGRTRKPQMKLAGDMGITDYPCPAGGCLLTDPAFTKRMKDLLEYSRLDMNNAELLKVGRHFRLTPEFKIVVGRDESENEKLMLLKRPGDTVFESVDMPGPTGIGRGLYDERVIQLAARIMARYIDHEGPAIEVQITGEGQGKRTVSAENADQNLLDEVRI